MAAAGFTAQFSIQFFPGMVYGKYIRHYEKL